METDVYYMGKPWKYHAKWKQATEYCMVYNLFIWNVFKAALVYIGNSWLGGTIYIYKYVCLYNNFKIKLSGGGSWLPFWGHLELTKTKAAGYTCVGF